MLYVHTRAHTHTHTRTHTHTHTHMHTHTLISFMNKLNLYILTVLCLVSRGQTTIFSLSLGREKIGSGPVRILVLVQIYVIIHFVIIALSQLQIMFFPTAMGELRTSTGIQTGPDPIFSRLNDKEKIVVWPHDTTLCYLSIITIPNQP